MFLRLFYNSDVTVVVFRMLTTTTIRRRKKEKGPGFIYKKNTL